MNKSFFHFRPFHDYSLGLTRKLLIPSLIVFSLIIGGLTAYNAITTVQQSDAAELTRLKNMSEVFNARLNSKADLALALASEIANNPEVQAAFAAKDRERLIELTLPSYQAIKDQFDLPQFQFHLPPATSFLRLHSLDKYGDDLSGFRFTVLAANAEQRPVSGPELGRAGLGVRGVVPVTYQGKHIGTVEFGTDIGSTLIEDLKSEFGFDMQILLSRAPAEVATFTGTTEESQGPIDELLLQASTLETPRFASITNYTNALAGSSTNEHINFNDREYAVYSTPLYDYSGQVIGVVDIISDHTVIAQQQNRQVISSTIVLLAILLVSGFAFTYFIGRLLRPIGELTSVASTLSAGDFSKRTNVKSNDELGTLARTFDFMAAQLQNLFGTLEQRIAARTRNLELAAEVGRAVSQVRKLDVMLKDACELILKDFNLYYVQVYLTDPSQTKLVLEAGTGDVGLQLLERGHNLPLDTDSINGRAAVEKRSVVIADTDKSASFRKNPLLSETRGEMAVPLIVADRVVGVLDMQSNQPDVLTEEVLPAFEALAGQMAVAVENANLLAQAEQARAQMESQARRLVREGWNEHLDAIHKPEQLGFVFSQNSITSLVETHETQLPEDGKAVSAPIAVTGEALGSLVVELDDTAHVEQTSELVNIVARQVAQQIENLRLLESAERYRAESERAARLQTVEGWQKYVESRTAGNLSFLYDTKEVRTKDGAKDDDSFMFAMPIKAREETIGKMSVEGLTPDDQESVDLVNAVSERLSAHIENLRLFEETRSGQLELDKRARQLAAVAEISNASSREMDVQKMLETVVHLTQRQFGLYHAHVFIFNEDTEELKIAACGWKEGDEHEGTHGTAVIPLNKEQSLVARAARTKKAVIVNNVLLEPGWLPNPLLPDTASELAVPLVIGERMLGVLDVQSDHINAFTEEDANIQTTLASQVATALQNVRSFTQAQKQAEREATLNVINQKIQSATSVEAVLQIAARELGHALGAPMTIAQLSIKGQN